MTDYQTTAYMSRDRVADMLVEEHEHFMYVVMRAVEDLNPEELDFDDTYHLDDVDEVAARLGEYSARVSAEGHRQHLLKHFTDSPADFARVFFAAFDVVDLDEVLLHGSLPEDATADIIPALAARLRRLAFMVEGGAF